MRRAISIPMLVLWMTTSCVLRPPSLTARMSALPSVPDPAPGAPPAAEAADDAQVIEAGCSFNGGDIKGDPGSVHALTCPAGCDKKATVYGTEVYSADSPVCAAAMHAGVISDRGGQTVVVLEPGRPAYRGSKRNGVQTHDWGSYRASYRFQGPVVAAAAPEPALAPVIVEAGCSLRGNDVQGDAGSAHRVSCPAGCKTNEAVWGSDPYTGDSPICVAAIHAGLATDRGGEFTLIVEDGRPAYRGSKRNGIESHDFGAYRKSFRFRH